MKNKTKYAIILIMMLLAAFSSLILSTMNLATVCGENSGCSIIQFSGYEKTFGISNAHLGLIAFPILALLTIFELRRTNKYRKRLIQLGILIGSGFAVYFLYLQFFVLKAICKYCIVADIAILVALGVIFLEEKYKK